MTHFTKKGDDNMKEFCFKILDLKPCKKVVKKEVTNFEKILPFSFENCDTRNWNEQTEYISM